MSNTLTIFIDIFNGFRYEEWANNMKSYLLLQDKWYVIRMPHSLLTTDGANVKDIEEWDKNDGQCIGNIRLHLTHHIHTKIGIKTSAKLLWDTIEAKYGHLGISTLYTEFHALLNTDIPSSANPTSAIDCIQAHFVCLKDGSFDIPNNVQAMMLLIYAGKQPTQTNILDSRGTD